MTKTVSNPITNIQIQAETLAAKVETNKWTISYIASQKYSLPIKTTHRLVHACIYFQHTPTETHKHTHKPTAVHPSLCVSGVCVPAVYECTRMRGKEAAREICPRTQLRRPGVRSPATKYPTPRYNPVQCAVICCVRIFEWFLYVGTLGCIYYAKLFGYGFYLKFS